LTYNNLSFLSRAVKSRTVEKPRAPAWGFSQRKSYFDLGAALLQALMAIHPRSSGRGILAFSRNPWFTAENGRRTSTILPAITLM
jgi:hypothetical protein